MRYFMQREDFKFEEVDAVTYRDVPSGYIGNRFRISREGLWFVDFHNIEIGDFLRAISDLNLPAWNGILAMAK